MGSFEKHDDFVTFTFDEVCKILKISRPTMDRILAQKKIKGIKVGKRWRFQPKHLREYLDSNSNRESDSPSES